jgi:ferredoxin
VDLVINLPKLKTHVLTFYTGAVKNLYGVIPGTRKREPHLFAPGVADFSSVLVDVLELVQPGLTILDGVLGLAGNGPGIKGAPRWYGCLAASADPVAVDSVIARSLGYRTGEILHLGLANARGEGVSDLDAIRVAGEWRALDFGRVELPKTHWYYRVPSWASAPIRRFTRVRPRLLAAVCIGCGRCVEVCPRGAIAAGRPPVIDLEACIGCFCCVEICPQGAVELRRGLVARLAGMGR